MRPSLLFTLLLLSILSSEVQGIRLKKDYLSVRHHKIHEGTVIRTSNAAVGEAIDDHCKDGHCSGTMKRRFSRVTKESHHSLPKIHEDYYGPRIHNPKHH